MAKKDITPERIDELCFRGRCVLRLHASPIDPVTLFPKGGTRTTIHLLTSYVDYDTNLMFNLFTYAYVQGKDSIMYDALERKDNEVFSVEMAGNQQLPADRDKRHDRLTELIRDWKKRCPPLVNDTPVVAYRTDDKRCHERLELFGISVLPHLHRLEGIFLAERGVHGPEHYRLLGVIHEQEAYLKSLGSALR